MARDLEELIRNLESDDSTIRKEVFWLGNDINHEVQQAIDKVMSDGKIDTQDMESLRHSNPRVRSELLSYIAESDGPQVVRLILPGLNDINPAVRAKAIESLTKIGT